MKTTAVSTADDGTKTTNTAKYVDYIHKDHLGSVEGVTGAAGARADAGVRSLRRPAQGGLDGGADAGGDFRAGGIVGPAHARAHGPRAPGPDGIHPSRGGGSTTRRWAAS